MSEEQELGWINRLGREIEDAMEANGGDRHKAVDSIVEYYSAKPERAVELVQGAGHELLGYCLRQWRHHTRQQPEQLRQDRTKVTNPLDRGFPTGPSGVFKTARELTREDVIAQTEMWRRTINGLKPRVEAGDELAKAMTGEDTVGDMYERGMHEEVATFLGVRYLSPKEEAA